MPKFFEELSKHFLNVALLFIGALIIQPFVAGQLKKLYLILGSVGYLSFLSFSFILMYLSEKLNKKRED